MSKTKFPHKGWVKVKGKFPIQKRVINDDWQYNYVVTSMIDSKMILVPDVRKYPESDRLPQGPVPFDFELERLQCKLN